VRYNIYIISLGGKGLNADSFHQKLHYNDFSIRVYLAILLYWATGWCELRADRSPGFSS
jgi:hypothetical protein